MQISYLSRNNGFQRCGQDKRFLKFSRGVFNFFYKCEAIQNPLHKLKVSCPLRTGHLEFVKWILFAVKKFLFHQKIVGFENPNFIIFS